MWRSWSYDVNVHLDDLTVYITNYKNPPNFLSTLSPLRLHHNSKVQITAGGLGFETCSDRLLKRITEEKRDYKIMIYAVYYCKQFSNSLKTRNKLQLSAPRGYWLISSFVFLYSYLLEGRGITRTYPSDVKRLFYIMHQPS